MTYRRIIAYGLIAGITVSEQQELTPGFVLDCYIRRQNYDDAMRGVRWGED